MTQEAYEERIRLLLEESKRGWALAEKHRVALKQINEIRNSIIGTQSLNWSEHAYPLVAILDAAGFEGLPYPEGRKNYGTLLERLATAEATIEKLNLELMERDTRPDYERGEMDSQDTLMRHLAKMDENNNSLMATTVKKSPYVQSLLHLLAQHADSLDCASYSFGQEFDPEAAKAFHSEFCIIQKRCELFAKDEVKCEG